MNVEIAERLAKRRREAGLSQEALAERLGVTRQAVSKWERSESSPDTDNLIALARLYGVSLDELLNFDPAIEDDMDFEIADRAEADRGEAPENEATDNEVSEGEAPQGEAQPEVVIVDDDSYVHINWRDGVHVKDTKSGEEVHVGWNGINIKGKDDGDSWSHGWEDWLTDDETVRDEDGFRVEIDGHEVYRKKFTLGYKFPFPLLVIIAYLLMGFFAPALVFPVGLISPWAYGCFLVALIPIYYMVVTAFRNRSPLRFLQSFWPLACVVGFLWASIMLGVPHPTWVIFLTIPLVEWLLETILRARRRAKRAAVEAIPVDVDKSDPVES